jgi:hypothetical protein
VKKSLIAALLTVTLASVAYARINTTYNITNSSVAGNWSWPLSPHPLNVLREVVMPYGVGGASSSFYDCYYRTTAAPNQPAKVGYCTRTSGPVQNPNFGIDCRSGNGAGSGQCRIDWVDPNGPPNTYARIGFASETVSNTGWVYTFDSDGPFHGRTGYGTLVYSSAFQTYFPEYRYTQP